MGESRRGEAYMLDEDQAGLESDSIWDYLDQPILIRFAGSTLKKFSGFRFNSNSQLRSYLAG